MKRHLFLLSSAISTGHSKFSAQERLDQTIVTIDSIRDRVPDAKIAIFESSALPLEQAIKDKLKSSSDFIAYMGDDPVIQTIYHGCGNWDMVKSFCEIIAFIRGMKLLKSMAKLDSQFDRVHKISGRYVLNEYFKPDVYELFPDKIIVPMKKPTQFTGRGEQFVGIPFYHPCMLWSWPMAKYDVILDFYHKCAHELNQRQTQNRFADIEHMMYMFLPKEDTLEIDAIGVEGNLGITGTLIRR